MADTEDVVININVGMPGPGFGPHLGTTSISQLALYYTVISYMSYMYLKVGTTHFYCLALCNLMLGLTNILLKSKLFR